jgi:hypothetical protein
MNTNLQDQDLESRLEDAFDAIANSIGTPTGDAADVWSTTKRRTVRRRRTRIFAGLGALAMVTTGGTARYVAVSNDAKKQVTVRIASDRDGVLFPSWFPRKTVLSFQKTNWLAGSPRTWHMVWGKGSTQIWIESSRRLPSNLFVNEAPVGGRYARWEQDGAVIYMAASDDVTKKDFDAVRARVTTNADGFAVVRGEPLGLPLLVQTFQAEYEDGWTVYETGRFFYGSSTEMIHYPISVHGQRRNPEYEKVPQGDFSTRTPSVVIRGVTGSYMEDGFSGSSSERQPSDPVTISWREGNVAYTVSADDKDTAVKIANSLRPPTDDEWEALLRPPSRPIDEPYVYSTDHLRDLGTVEVAGGIVEGTAEELSTDGCAKLKLTVGGKDESMCVKLTEEPVMWSGIRTVNDKRVVVAIVSDAVDAARIVNNDTPAINGTVNDNDIELDWVSAGTPVFLDSSGIKNKWIGLVALETDDPAPLLETLHNVNLDPTPDNTDREPLLNANDELLTPLRPLSRTPVTAS